MPDGAGRTSAADGAPWWRGAVVYQVYPSSFADGNGDGRGDLLGVVERLDHLTALGVDAVWLSPIHPSGGADGGYDVTDYLDVDAAYGGLPALDRLIEATHAAGLRVLLDFVPNHTSDRHPWFVEARATRLSPRRDWYVWADGPGNGGPPNNWLSGFGGPAWVWDEGSQQFYLASFYPEQADLNWRNPDVRAAMADVLRFWIDRGVDGFRVDVVHRLAKDPGLADNPIQPGLAPEQAWATQSHVFDHNWPEGHAYLRELRRLVGRDTLLLGEVWILEPQAVFEYLRPGELDLAFNFLFATAPWDARALGGAVRLAESLGAVNGWPCYHLSNHDEPRHATRHGERVVRAAAVLLLTLRGTVVLYQGEEIGMVDGAVPQERRRDRAGRDGCRTPMQWDASPSAGFAPPGAEPWLPLADVWERRNVAAQAADEDSVLALYRRLLALRRRSPAVRSGAYREVPAPPGLLAYRREESEERLLVVVNTRSEAVDVSGPAGTVEVATRVAREGERTGGRMRVGADEALVVRLAPDVPKEIRL